MFIIHCNILASAFFLEDLMDRRWENFNSSFLFLAFQAPNTEHLVWHWEALRGSRIHHPRILHPRICHSVRVISRWRQWGPSRLRRRYLPLNNFQEFLQGACTRNRAMVRDGFFHQKGHGKHLFTKRLLFSYFCELPSSSLKPQTPTTSPWLRTAYKPQSPAGGHHILMELLYMQNMVFSSQSVHVSAIIRQSRNLNRRRKMFPTPIVPTT